MIRIALDKKGLSPPVRGSRVPSFAGRQARGSIPARAGEPLIVPEPCRLDMVYPRPCGGAPFWF